MNVQKSTIIIPVRNEYKEVELAIKYAKQNQSVEHDYLVIYDIENKKETTPIIEGVTQLFPTYDDVKFIENEISRLKKYSEEQNRLGIVALYEYGVKQVKNDYLFLLHGDMIPAPQWDIEMFKHMAPKTTVCGTRIEPKIFGADKAKYQEECGIDANTFDYNKFVQACNKYSNDEVVEGFFAPHLYKTEEWIGYNPAYCPQSREEQSITMRMFEKDYKMLNSRSAMFYHFGAMGSRRKDDRYNDSEEWKKTNYKNERNFLREYKQPIITNDYCLTQKMNYTKTISLGIIVGDEDPTLLFNMIKLHEPFFDEVYMCFDTTQPPNVINSMKDAVNKYIVKEKETCEIFDENKFKFITKPLNKDFANFRNEVAKINQCDWMLMLDVDEFIEPKYIAGIRGLIEEINTNHTNINVVGLPRINIIDNVIQNDFMNNKQANPDFQYRLVKKGIMWQNTYPQLGAIPGCHEMPIEVHKNKDKVLLCQVPYIVHPKTATKQLKQNSFYNTISNNTKNTKNIIYDSVLFTREGITKHAVEEIKEWYNKKYNVKILDNYYNELIDTDGILAKCYIPLNISKGDYITIINQPPSRWNNSIMYKNRIAYLAFEGLLPDNWVKDINESNMLRIWTPSEYCKECFIKSGVIKPIDVIPHGVSNIYKPNNEPKSDNITTLLWSGAPNSKRKNIELMLDGFVIAYKDNPNIKLIIKVNKIYDNTFDINKIINKIVPEYMWKQIQYIDNDITEEEMIKLFNSVDVYVSTSYSEGFGMQILESLACGTPVITTQGTGQDQIINDKNIKGILSVNNTNREIWAPLIHPYEKTKWIEPNTEHFVEQLKLVAKKDEYNKLKQECLSSVDYIHENWSWKNVVELMEKKIKEV